MWQIKKPWTLNLGRHIQNKSFCLHNICVCLLCIFVAIANNTLHGSKLLILLLCQKSLDINSCSMKIFCTVNISKLNYWLLICIANNFIWTTLKVIFSIFWFFCTLRFQIFKYCPIITNNTSMEILFIHISNFEILMLMTVFFLLQGHIYIFKYTHMHVDI